MTIEEIKAAVEQELGIENLGVKSRQYDYVIARTMYFVLCKRHTSATLSVIGKLVNRDHSSVCHGIKIYNDIWMNNVSQFKRELVTMQTIEEELGIGFTKLKERPEVFQVYKKQEQKIAALEIRVKELEQENKDLKKYRSLYY